MRALTFEHVAPIMRDHQQISDEHRTERLIVRVEPELVPAIKLAARRDGRTVSGFLRNLAVARLHDDIQPGRRPPDFKNASGRPFPSRRNVLSSPRTLSRAARLARNDHDELHHRRLSTQGPASAVAQAAAAISPTVGAACALAGRSGGRPRRAARRSAPLPGAGDQL